MGAQKTTQTTSIPGASGNEAQLMSLMTQLAKQFGGQFGDLSELAKGGVGGPSEEDYQLVSQSIGRTGEMAQREAERILGPLMAQLTEQSTGSGTTGSSMDKLSRILGGREISGRLADILSGAQQQGGQALLNLPFQRAESKMGANRLLLEALTGAANPVLSNSLQSRMANQTTTQTTPRDFGQIFQLAAGIGGMPFTGGASGIGALGALSGGGGGVRRGQLSGQSNAPNLDYLGMYGLGGR